MVLVAVAVCIGVGAGLCSSPWPSAPGYPEAAETNLAVARITQAGDAMTPDHPATQIHAAREPRVRRSDQLPPGRRVTVAEGSRRAASPNAGASRH
jgi:hypothetical protein